MRSRYYDPAIGRFISKDLLVKSAPGSQGYNRYAYVANDPTNAVDPSGSYDSFDGGGSGGDEGLDLELPWADAGLGTDSEWVRAQLPGLGTEDGTTACPNSRQPSSASSQTMAQIRTVGDAGEQAAGITKNNEHIDVPSKGSNFRVPDVLDRYGRVIGEVKNVSYQYYSRQLQDYVAFAQKYEYRFELTTRVDTVLSPQLQAAVDQGLIILRRVLP